MYDVNDYGRMMADAVRMQAYTEALRRAVKPGCVVVDVGTGTGIFALLAAKFGARKVYAIDTNPCIHLAREVAKASGFAEQIEFIQKSVFDVELPEKADILVGDCRGAFSLSGRHPELMFYARDHFLRRPGIVIPDRDELFMSIIEWPEVYASLERPWVLEGFDWAACRRDAMSTRLLPDSRLVGARVLFPPTKWAEIDYARSTESNARGSVRGPADIGSAHFVALSFKAVAAGLEFGSMPNVSAEVYGPTLLPLYPPLPLVKDDPIEVEITAVAGASDYVFGWRLRNGHGTRRQTNGANATHVYGLNSRGERGILRAIGECDD